MSHQGKPSTSTTSDAAQFVSRGGKGGRGRGGGGGRGQSSNKQQQQKTRQNTPGGGSGAQQGSKTTRPVVGAAPAATPAAAQNGAGERKDGGAAPKQTQSYVPKAAPATAVPPSPSSSSAAAPPAGTQQLPVPTAATPAHQPTHQQSAAPAADGNGTTGAAALPAPSPHAPPTTGGQGPAPPYVGYTNGAGAPPPGGRGRGIPPRTQSAPPNLKEQKQSPIFIPTRATPNAGAFPAAPYYPPSGPYYPPPPGVQPGVSPTHPYAPPGQGVPPPRGGPNLYQPPGHGRAQGPPGAGAHAVGPQGGPPPAMGGPLPQNVGGPQMPPQQPMGPTTYVPPHRIPTFVPGRAAPFIPRGHAGLQPMPPPHSMPIQIPQKRTSRIPIIDPKTGKEVGNSPPKDESPLNDNASPYQQSPPGAGLRIPHGGGIISHPYAPAGTSPSRQAPHFKPDDFADGGPVEQFAPNHPYAPGRSAAIPIEKPPSAAVTISKPPAPAEAATTPAPATTTATTPASVEQPSASAPQEPAKEAAAPATAESAAPAQEPTTKPAEVDKKEAEVSPPEKQQQKPEEEASKQPEESKAETPAPQAAKPEPTVEERKPEEPAPEVKPEEAVPEAAKQQPEEAKQVEQAPAADAAKEESSEKASEAQPAEPASAPEPTPAMEKPTDEAEPGKAGEQKPATEESGKKTIDSRAGKAKPTRKGSVKKSDEGDARPSEAAEKKASEDADKKPTEEHQKPKEEEQPPAKPAEAEQDDDDWEVKAEKEDLVLQKDISLRPSYSGSSGTQAPFRSTLTPQAGDASWSGSGSKRTYDRDFLLKFQTFCRERPDGLPPVEVILGSDDRAKGGAGGGGRGGKGGRGGGGMNSSGEWSRGQQQFANRGRGGPGMFAAAPGKFNAPPGLSAPMARGPGAARGAPQGGPMRRVPKKGMPGREAPPGIMPPPEPVAPMVDNPTVWKPSRRRGDDNEEIYGKVRSILNKLTSDKFGPLSGQMVELLKSKATTVEILREIINIIFDKALAEPGFSTMYAELCRVLEKNCPTFETNKEGKPQTFKRILLNRCQEAFEHKPNEEQPTDDPLKKEEMEIKQKRRMIGNIVFIGELYKEHMLTDKIMHECVFRRLLGEMKNPAEADLEALCKLMNTIGKVLDVPKAKNYMEAYFKRMKTLSQNPNIPSRIRFLLLDVLDLRANKWVSSVTEKPKQGGRGGAQPKSAGSAGPASAGGPGGRGGGGSGAYRPGGAGGAPQGGRASQDGWETVGRGGHSRGDRSERGGDRGGSTGSERGPPVTLSSGEVVLGPNQSRMGTMMGGTGAKGWRDANKGRPQDSRRDAASSSRPGAAPAAAPKGNIFAALSDMPERSPQAESRQSARPTSGRDRSRSREDREGPAPSPRGDRGDARKEAAAPSPRSAEKETEVAVGPLDPETEKSIKLLLEEFLDTQDEEEARQCVDDIEGSGFQPHLVKAIIVMATEKKEEVREMLLQLITHFHKKATITPAHFTAGLRLVLEQLDDIRLDAPMAPKVVGQFIGSALLDEYLNASFVLPALEPLVESGSALTVLVGLFNFYVENTSIGDTREFAKEAGWDVTSMFKKSKRDPASVTEWIQVNGLDRVFPVAWAQGRLKALLESGDDAGKILTWMEENVARDVWDDEEFVQRLTGVFVEFVGARTKALSDAQAVAEEETKLFEQYAPLLKRFTADSPQTQQACLAAVQRFCFDLNFPDGLLERLFQNLLDNELVDDDAFSTWAADTQDSFGKSQALAQVSGWLSGAQKDDGEGAP